MSVREDRKNAAMLISGAAQSYKNLLVGKRFLYVFDGRYIEVLFESKNFRHLTGVATNLSAERFFKYAIGQKLSASQIWFDANHPYALSIRKLKHLNDVANMSSSENFMLEDISTDTKTYKFGTTDLHFTLCMGRPTDSEGNEIGDCYIVESLRDEDSFSRSADAFVVTHILSRPNDEKKYSDILFMDKSATLNDLPDEVKRMLSDELLGQIAPSSGE